MAMMSKIFDSMHPTSDKAAKDKNKEYNKMKRSAFMDKVNLFRDKHYDIKDAQSYRSGDDKSEIVGSKSGKWDGSQPEHIQMVDSTAIQDATYNPKTGDMSIKFKGGKKTYVYPDVPEDVAAGFKRASSKGRFFNAEIKPYSINQ